MPFVTPDAQSHVQIFQRRPQRRIDFARRAYDPGLAYAQSKTANVLFAVEAARRWADDGIEVNALHPGAIADSQLSRHYDPAVLEDLRSSGRYTFKPLQQGAATSVFVATSPLLEGIGGRYNRYYMRKTLELKIEN